MVGENGVIWPPFCKNRILEQVERYWSISQWGDVVRSVVVPAVHDSIRGCFVAEEEIVFPRSAQQLSDPGTGVTRPRGWGDLAGHVFQRYIHNRAE